MKRLLVWMIVLTNTLVFAQSKGTISGTVYDKEANNMPLPFANVFIKGTSVGATTEFEGTYSLSIAPGTYTLVFSFIGYQSIEVPNVVVASGEELSISKTMSASQGVSLEEIQISGSTKKESETALLTEQKKATVIKESIGAQRLSKMGVSNAATAAAKIAGVSKNESSGDIYIRGLGDRYLSTTMNGLPIPSDDVENKNIDLNLFSTDLIQNVGISKTYDTGKYADQASGNVNIVSKQYGGETFSVGLSTGSNTNVAGDVWNTFKATQNSYDQQFGFYTQKYALIDAISRQSWNTTSVSAPLNMDLNFAGGTKVSLFGNDLSVFVTAAHKQSFAYETGMYKKFRSNVLDNAFTDTESFGSKFNTTGLIDLRYRFNSDHKISYNTLFVNKTTDKVYEQGRNGEGYVFDQDPAEYGAFVRDQNLQQTRMFVNQLLGNHRLTQNNTLKWAVGYNYVWATEPNRIRNEVNILDENTVQFAHVGDFQQRKSSQKIVDTEINGYLKDQWVFTPEANHPLTLNMGLNFRQKERDFKSVFKGVRAKNVQVASIDDLDAAFNKTYFDNNTIVVRDRDPDLYNAELTALSGFMNLHFGVNKFSGNAGLRYEIDALDILWDVANYVGRVGNLQNKYHFFLPSLNLKYELNEQQFIRFAASKTTTLPEFKELAPFEYVSPTGRVTKGNPDLKESTNYNLDLKWEWFPAAKELVSFTGFYKNIQDPINLTQTRGSSGNFIFENTGEKASVFGLELETRLGVLQTDTHNLDINLNATKMWFKQDLLPTFQYNQQTSSDLQGASGFILNTAISYETVGEKAFLATLSGNYSSDKIYALGAPEDFDNSDVLFNDEIIEKGFVSLDLVLSKKFSDHWSLGIKGKNLLNPAIEQTQQIRSLSTQVVTNETVNSYRKGIDLNIGLKYTF